MKLEICGQHAIITFLTCTKLILVVLYHYFTCGYKNAKINLWGASKQTTGKSVLYFTKQRSRFRPSHKYQRSVSYLPFAYNMCDAKREKEPVGRKVRETKETCPLLSGADFHLEKSAGTSATSSDSIWRPLSDHLTVLLPHMNAWSSQDKGAGSASSLSTAIMLCFQESWSKEMKKQK